MIYSGKTDENGKIVIKELAVGKYYIVEENPIEGYVSSDEKVLFEIKENGEIVKAKMTNKKISSTLKISPSETLYCFPPTLITALMQLPPS